MGYSTKLQLSGNGILWDDPPQDVMCHVGTKYLEGNSPLGRMAGTLPVPVMCVERWDEDLHFYQYTSSLDIRLNKDFPDKFKTTWSRIGLRFDFLCFDLEPPGHTSIPSRDDWKNLLRIAYLIDQTPNIVYQTVHGARWVYFIQSLTDPDKFESHYVRLQSIVGKLLDNSDTPYKMDYVHDWNRPYRAPKVNRDGKRLWDYSVRWFHSAKLNIERFIPTTPRKKKPQYEITNTKFTMDRTLVGWCNTIAPGDRNKLLFKAACRWIRVFDSDGQDRWEQLFRDKVVDSDFSDKEFDNTIKSARRTVEGGVK